LAKTDNHDEAEAELAQEFKEYLQIIGSEISEPLKGQVAKNGEVLSAISNISKQLNEVLPSKVDSIVNRKIDKLSNDVIKIYAGQQSRLASKLDGIQHMSKQMGALNKRVTELEKTLKEPRLFEMISLGVLVGILMINLFI
jgi:DNA anti-recombination protein RmuC